MDPHKRLRDRPDYHLKVVHEISELINHTTGIDTILRQVVDKISDSIHFDVVSIYLWDGQAHALVLRANRGLRINHKRPVTLKPGEGLTGLVYASKRPLMAMPASEHPNYKYIPQIGEKRYEGYIGAPILLHNQCLGVLVGQAKAKRQIHPSEATMFGIIASRLAGVLEVAGRLDRLKTPASVSHTSKAHQGMGVSSGFAVGRVQMFEGLYRGVDVKRFKGRGPAEETARLNKAIHAVKEDLAILMDTLKAEGVLAASEIDIFKAHRMILDDPTFFETITQKLRTGKSSAELAVVEGVESIAQQLEAHEDRYLRERSHDFRDIGEKILRHLLGSRGAVREKTKPKKGAVMVAHHIGPSFLATLSKENVAAIVTEVGGITSHTAILAKSLRIPAVVGVENITGLLKSSQQVLVDGKTGFVFSDPDRGLIQEYRDRDKEHVRVRKLIEKLGKNYKNAAIECRITANIGFPLDLDHAQQYKLDAAGLFRTEFSFMQFDRWPTVPEQIAIYEKVAKYFDSYITIRTLDIGGDKTLPYFPFPAEANPLLGFRSIRFSMENLDSFRDQLRAILLTVQKGYQFRILLPLVTNLWEVETARELLEEIGREVGLQKSKLPKIGIMMETPAVLAQLDDYWELIDFISVGTNDLIQYMLAVDRNSNIVGHLYSGLHPAVLRALDDILKRAAAMGKEADVCGEMAGTPEGTLALVAMGYRNLSVMPSRAPLVRYIISQVDDHLLADVRFRILTEKREVEIRSYLGEVLESINPVLTQVE